MVLTFKHQSLFIVLFLLSIVAYSFGMWCCGTSPKPEPDAPKPDAKSTHGTKAKWVGVVDYKYDTKHRRI